MINKDTIMVDLSNQMESAKKEMKRHPHNSKMYMYFLGIYDMAQANYEAVKTEQYNEDK